MKMNMKDRLPRIGIRIRHDPETAFVIAPLFCETRCDPEQMPDQEVIFRQKVKRMCYMLSRYQQKMERGSRIDILDRDQILVLENSFCRDLTGNDLTEKA
jgi:hypothetical protein